MVLTPEQQRRSRMRRMNLLMAYAALSAKSNEYSPQFSPESLFSAGEQGAWYDVSDITTMFQDAAGTIPVTAAGQPVGRINDKSGRGNHATQSTAGARPILRQDVNSRWYLEFDGTDDSLSTGTINPGSVDKAQVFVGAFTSSTANQGIVQFGNAGTGNLNVFLGASSPPFIRSSLNGSTGSSQMRVNGPALNTPMVITQTYDIAGATAADESQIRLNGTLPSQTVQAAGPAGAGNFQSHALAVGNFAGVFFLSGRIYSFIIRFSAANLDAATIAQAETWINGKTGAY